MATDNFVGPAESVMPPARRLVAVTPDDDNDLAEISRAISVGADGDLEVIAADDTAAVVVAVKAGTLYPLRAKRVLSGSTTATGVVAWY